MQSSLFLFSYILEPEKSCEIEAAAKKGVNMSIDSP